MLLALIFFTVLTYAQIRKEWCIKPVGTLALGVKKDIFTGPCP